MNLLIAFTLLSIFNVVGSTIRSLLLIKGGKWLSSIVSALYYGYYTIVIVYTVADFPLWQKVAVTFGCNVVGVFIVKLIEEKSTKDKLWKIECTVVTERTRNIDHDLADIPHSYIHLSDKHTLFSFYCATQKESAMVKEYMADFEDAKFFVAESKIL